MSFAIIETGGKQYKVTASKILEIEKLEAKVGETIKFKNVLLLNDDKNTEIGSPSINGATVEAKLLDNVKDRTVLVFHKRRRKHSRKKNGHRQRHSKIQITKIALGTKRTFFKTFNKVLYSVLFHTIGVKLTKLWAKKWFCYFFYFAGFLPKLNSNSGNYDPDMRKYTFCD